jgi:assimilatory nitrate reductase catalytic subunit
VRRFWQAPNLVTGEGFKAVQMFEAIARGEIKALWVMGTNPAVSLPRADAVRDAMRELELLVVSENVATGDTASLAHVRLPAHAWGEKNGTVTNSERRISRQRPFLSPAGEAQADWWALSQIAQRFGWGEAFAYRSAADVFREHAKLSSFENNGTRIFDIGGLAGISDEEFEAFEPIQWPVRGKGAGTERLFADGGFQTANRRANIVPIGPARLANLATETWPFVLNTGRIRDQWHTMTRTGLSPRLSVHVAEPFVEIHPVDAARLGLVQGGLARVESMHGEATLKAMLNEEVAQGSLFVPIHWTGTNSSQARIGALVHAAVDPLSGQPEAKATPARIQAAVVSHYGFVLARSAVKPAAASYWATAPFAGGHITFIALDAPPTGWTKFAESELPDGQRLIYEDANQGMFRTAVLSDNRLQAVMYVAPQPTMPSMDWLKSRFAIEEIAQEERRALLAGRPLSGCQDDGPIVCVCHQVGRKSIEAAIGAGAGTAEDVGVACKAGTNCGSCVPEIKRMLSAARPAIPDAAE